MNHPTASADSVVKNNAALLLETISGLESKAHFRLSTSCGCIVEVSENQRCYATELPLEWLSAPVEIGSELSITQLSEKPNRVTRPMDELLWILGYYSYMGKLTGACRRDDVVKIERWPNLTRLPHQNSFHRISALLTARPTSIVLASKLLSLPEAEVCHYYQAASSAHYTHVVNRPQVHAESITPPKNPSLLKRLFQRLAH